MLKRIMFFLMILETAVRFFGLTLLFSTNADRLPIPVYVSAGIVAVFGIILICKNILKSVSKKELAIFYIAASISVVFNLIYMKLFSRVELSLIDLSVIGTLMDIVVSATLVILTVREKRYVQIRVNSDR